MNKLFKDIAEYIINEIQNNSTSSKFQYVISEGDIEEKFGVEIKEFIEENILNALQERKEVSDVFLDTDGYDVTLKKK